MGKIFSSLVWTSVLAVGLVAGGLIEMVVGQWTRSLVIMGAAAVFAILSLRADR